MTIIEPQRVRRFLLVDDDDADAEFMRRAFQETNSDAELLHTDSPSAAIELLEGKRVELLILDLNMPQCNGLDLLREIRNNPTISETPVIILSSSANQADVDASYALGANAYAVKPSSTDCYKDFAVGFSSFWLGHTLVPRK